MTKRRRERDRPKAGPEAPYNPHKRVLLSYSSDDDEDGKIADRQADQTTPALEHAPDDASHSDCRVTQYVEEDGETGLGVSSGSTANVQARIEEGSKVDQSAGGVTGAEVEEELEEEEDEEEPVLQHPHGTGTGDSFDMKKNPVTNQFPFLGPPPDEEEYDSTTEEAMAYLEDVRAERQSIPEILTASRQVPKDYDEVEGGQTDVDHLLEDGTYVGLPTTSLPEQDDSTDPQTVFTKVLRGRFLHQRRQLQIPPGARSLAELGHQCPISYPRGSNRAAAEWHRILSSKSPMPAQLRALDQDTAFSLLALLQRTHLVKGKNIKVVTSSWIWSLLARLDDVGNMNNDQVFRLRELGKKVVFLLLHFFDTEVAKQLEAFGRQGAGPPQSNGSNEISLEEDLLEIERGIQGNIQPAVKRYTKTHHAKPSENTLATLDMILVVVGEVFGQRDLLQFRRPWTVTEQPSAA